MNKLLLTAGITLAVFSSADADAARFKPKATFNADEVSWIYGDGENTVTGSVHVRANNGMVMNCAGREVSLIPDSEFAKERITFLYGSPMKGTNVGRNLPAKFGPKKYEKQAASYRENILKAMCNIDGEFAFESVPDGTYYLTGGSYWQQSSSGSVYGSGVLSGMEFKMAGSWVGKNFMERISVSGGDVIDLEFIGTQ